MFKNTVFKSSVDTKKWLLNACIRAIKTFAETMLGFVIVGQAFNEIGWLRALSVSGVATLASLLISVTGLPEVESEE